MAKVAFTMVRKAKMPSRAEEVRISELGDRVWLWGERWAKCFWAKVRHHFHSPFGVLHRGTGHQRTGHGYGGYGIISPARRGAGVDERGGLENRCGLCGHRGFESHPLRQKLRA